MTNVLLMTLTLGGTARAAELSWTVTESADRLEGSTTVTVVRPADLVGAVSVTCTVTEDGAVEHQVGPLAVQSGATTMWTVAKAPRIAATCHFTAPKGLSRDGKALTSDASPPLTVTFVPSALPSLAAARAAFSVPAPDLSKEAQYLSALDTAAPDWVVDTLQLLASIAYERARSRAYAIIGDRVEDWVCEDAKTSGKLELRVGTPTNGHPPVLTLTVPNDTRLLPGTCETLRSLDGVIAWANNPETVVRALEGDLYDFASRLFTDGATWSDVGLDGPSGAWLNTHGAFLLRTMSGMLRDNALEGSAPTTEDARQLLAALGTHDWTEGSTRTVDKPLGQALGLAFAAAGPCILEPNTCDAARVARVFADPQAHYSDLGELVATPWWPKVSPRLQAAVGEMLDIVQADPDDAGKAERAAVGLAFDLADVVLTVAEQTGTDGQRMDVARVRALLAPLRTTFGAIADRDTAGATTAALTLLATALDQSGDKATQTLRLALLRAAPVVTVLAANAKSLEESKADPEAAAEQREARKEALEAVIDASTNRDGREGEWIASLGANVGVQPVRFSAEGGKLEVVPSEMPVTLPMGIALQRVGRLPENRAGVRLADADPCFGAGFHLQLSVVDLALFLPEEMEDPTEDLQWSDFLMAGGQVGLALYRPQDVFTVAFDGRYTPYDDTRTWQIGVVASYYVPFFDLN